MYTYTCKCAFMIHAYQKQPMIAHTPMEPRLKRGRLLERHLRTIRASNRSTRVYVSVIRSFSYPLAEAPSSPKTGYYTRNEPTPAQRRPKSRSPGCPSAKKSKPLAYSYGPLRLHSGSLLILDILANSFGPGFPSSCFSTGACQYGA